MLQLRSCAQGGMLPGLAECAAPNKLQHIRLERPESEWMRCKPGLARYERGGCCWGAAQVTPQSKFKEDLALDSLDTVEVGLSAPCRMVLLCWRGLTSNTSHPNTTVSSRSQAWCMVRTCVGGEATLLCVGPILPLWRRCTQRECAVGARLEHKLHHSAGSQRVPLMSGQAER